MANIILRLPAVKARTGLSRSTIYLRISRGEFPRQVPLGSPACVGWVEREVEQWISRRIHERNARNSVPDVRPLALDGQRPCAPSSRRQGS